MGGKRFAIHVFSMMAVGMLIVSCDYFPLSGIRVSDTTKPEAEVFFRYYRNDYSDLLKVSIVDESGNVLCSHEYDPPIRIPHKHRFVVRSDSSGLDCDLHTGEYEQQKLHYVAEFYSENGNFTRDSKHFVLQGSNPEIGEDDFSVNFEKDFQKDYKILNPE